MRQPSRQQILALALCSAVCLISAVPVPQPAGNQELDVLQIPLANGKEIDVLTLGAKDQEQLIADRNKRTIGLLRELFPDITKEINMQINRLVNNVLARVGPIVLGTVLNPQFDPTILRHPSDEDDSDTDTDTTTNTDTDSDNKNGDKDERPSSDKDYESLPEELTRFEPDGEFAGQTKEPSPSPKI
ncbi:uncharacterized protein LOC6603943 isoform X4 [Drosophila persimilis]|uniref:uncharacterized protein LOC6603943 isoform X4 n=1 Tax=Drosophila persimilis TaxID=7234 RepID=UPI000F09982E|nr:uncharacterized protein LOC6603943 isoform X4 [Drosophila persimilis]